MAGFWTKYFHFGIILVIAKVALYFVISDRTLHIYLQIWILRKFHGDLVLNPLYLKTTGDNYITFVHFQYLIPDRSVQGM